MPRKSADSKQLQLVFPESTEYLKLQEENNRLRAENERLQAQAASLIDEINRLRQFGTIDNIPETVSEHSPHTPYKDTNAAESSPPFSHPVTKRSSISDKVALFRTYFRGREDVYAVRGKEQNGKAPYYPKRQYIRKENGEYT